MRTLAAALALSLLPALLAGCLSDADDGGLLDGGGCPAAPAPTVQEVVAGNMQGGGRVGDGARQEVPFPLDAWTGPWSCVRAVEVTITWTNGPEAGADLYVGYDVPAADLHVVGNDRQQYAVDGTHTERVLGPAPADASRLATDLVVVLYTDWASLSAAGLPVQVEVRLHVDP